MQYAFFGVLEMDFISQQAAGRPDPGSQTIPPKVFNN
jgi:hypothetical protein